MENKNVIAAISLSAAVIILYSLFFQPDPEVVKKNLAKYKQPKEFYCLEQLPKNTMGKIQKNILKEMFNS